MPNPTYAALWSAEMAFLRRHRGTDADQNIVDPTLVPIGDAPCRIRIRVQGQVTRMRARPTSGEPSLAVNVSDATGTIAAVWTGRRAIGGVTLGRNLILEGVAVSVGDRLELTNPAYTLLP